jgi:DNA replication protein DnaC
MALSNETLSKALNSVLERRKIAERKYEQLKADIYSLYPDLEVNETKLQKLSAKLALTALSGNENAVAELKKQIETVRTAYDKTAALASLPNGPQYTCKMCNDTGYADSVLCNCVKDIASKLSYASLISDMPIETSTFETFDLTLYPVEKNSIGVSPFKQMSARLKICKQFVNDFPNGENLLFTGGCGLGKTHLSLAIANEIIGKDFGVIYGSAQNLINRVSRETFDRQGSTAVIDSLTSCDLLILDDLGTEFATPLSVSVVYNIINTRLLKGLSTIISTNLSVNEISEIYNDRIASRIVGSYTICPFFGNDIRQINSVNNK